MTPWAAGIGNDPGLGYAGRRDDSTKQFSHAWLAFKAIERLEKADLGTDRQNSDELIRSAWYPDMIINGMAARHGCKITPRQGLADGFESLPSICLAG